MTQEEVDRARQKILKDRELAAADPNRIAIELSEWAAQGDWRLYFLNRDRIEQVTPAQVKDGRREVLHGQQPDRRLLRPDRPSPSGRRSRRRPISPSWSTATPAGRSRPSASETSDVAPLAIEARLQRPEPIGGVKLAFLPKKTRGESVQLRLTLHYGNAENLKGLNEAAGFLPELMIRGTQRPDPPADPGRRSTRTSPGSAPAWADG